MASRRSPKGPRPVEAIKHRDKRVNIPTEELREFVRAEEESPKTLLYPRDPSLDPQLVWKGKDEQDREPLEVPVVPVYIQEKIHPQALIENLRDTAKEGEAEPELALFDDFNGVKEFRQKIDFYSHDLGSQPKWANRMILGDSLLVITSLAEKEGLKGKVQMIYVDPPYGIKFGSNWQVSTRKRDVKDGKVEDATRQPEQIKAFRDTWELGIHSYLAYLRDRFVVARDLLTETGSIFVQIGDENVHLVRNVMDEVFGSENFAAQINFRSMTALGQEGLASVYDYILWYSKSKDSMKFRDIYRQRTLEEEPEFCFVADEAGDYQKFDLAERKALPVGAAERIFKRSELRSSGYTPTCVFDFELYGSHFSPAVGNSWRTHREGMRRLVQANRLIALGVRPYFRQYHSDYPVIQFENSWHDTAAGFSETKVYVVQTTDRIVERCLLMATDPGDLVLDPTCGSGTTGVVAEQWGRRWITIDTSRVALALARTRLMSAKYPYYLLTDSPEGRQREAEITGSTAVLSSSTRAEGDIKKGFVYRRVPHVTLKSIANNEEIDAIHARHEEKLGPLREELIGLLKQTWQEWEVPREADGSWPDEAKKYHAEWWKLRRERQEEIDDSIKRRGRHRAPLQRPLRGRQTHPRDRSVHGREPFTPSGSFRRRRPPILRDPGPRRGCGRDDAGAVRDDDPREPAQGRRPEHAARRAAGLAAAGAIRGRLDPGRRRVRRRRRKEAPRCSLDRAGARNCGSEADPGSGEGSFEGGRVRPPARPGIRFRRPRERGGEGNFSERPEAAGRLRRRVAGGVRAAAGPPRPHEPGSLHGRGPPQKDRRRKPLHGVRRAGHGDPDGGGREDRRRDPRRGRLRPDDRRHPQLHDR
jgi:adenine-specific DNA-methyltransferase